MGERTAVRGALDNLIHLHDAFGEPSAAPELQDIWKWRGWRDDDQFLWQVSLLKQQSPIHVDCESRLMLNLSSVDHRLIGNKDCQLDHQAGRVTIRSNGAQPALLHFSGAANRHCKQQWAGYLGSFAI